MKISSIVARPCWNPIESIEISYEVYLTYMYMHTKKHYIIYTLHSFLYHTHTFLYFLRHKHKKAFFKKHKIEFNFFSSEIIMIHNHHKTKQKNHPTHYISPTLCYYYLRLLRVELRPVEISCKFI